MKNNSYRKLFKADKFGWKYYCSHAARNQRKWDKVQTSKANRRNDKEITTREINEYKQEREGKYGQDE